MDQFILLFLILVVYIIILFIIKKLEIGIKIKCENCNNCCPRCKTALNRTRRSYKDVFITNLTFRIFDFKHYTCSECNWDGLRWEKNYRLLHK